MKSSPVLIVHPDPQDLGKYASILVEARHAVLQATGFPEAAGDPCPAPRPDGRPVVPFGGGRVRPPVSERHVEKIPLSPVHLHGRLPAAQFGPRRAPAGGLRFYPDALPPDILLHSVARSVQKLSLTLETEKQEKEIRKLLDRSREDLKDARTHSSFKGFMISMAAHDFRSIITVLDGTLQLVKERCAGCEVSGPGGILEQATRTIGRLRTMAGTLLDYEAAESGSIRLDIHPFPLVDMLKECAAFYRQYAEQKRIHLLLEGDPLDVTVRGDRGKVMEILDNLVYNALKFTPSQGTIRLSGKKEGGFAVICVSDSGAGIPKEKLRKIFDQGDIVATLDSNARLGLGLTICKRLVEAQKGKIRVDSDPGNGTQVHFSLPTT